MNLCDSMPLADVAVGPTIATTILIPVLVVAVVVIAAVVLIKAIRKRRNK